jgi:hypothetical protein
MLRQMKFVAVALAALWVAEPALAQYNQPRPRANMPNLQLKRIPQQQVRPRLPAPGVNIQPSEAAAIAQSMFPDAIVVKVRLRPDGIYAVTLRTDNSVERVMVSGEDGSVL